MMNRSKKITLLFLFTACGFLAQAQIEKKQEAAVEKLKESGVPVSGVVTDAATGKALRGISVTYKDVAAAITDSLGAFTIKVPSAGVSLTLNGEGFQSKEVALRGRTTVKAALYEDTYTSFYDAATLPTGQTLKSKTPFAVASVQTNGAWTSTSETPSSYLQGQVAGLNAVRRSGTPNAGATLSLRGMTSLYATNQPLIVVDGVIFDNNDNNGSIVSNHYTEPLATLDVRDIDNITVLKDGASLYGSKGANGVILITTARARQLGTRIDFAAYGGANFTPETLPVMDAGQYRTYLSDLLKTKGLSDADMQALPYLNDNRSNPDYYRYHNNTDWQKTVLRQSYSRNVYLKVTGGDNIAKYGLSLGYLNTDALTRNTGLNRYNMRFNGDLNLSRRMTATTNLSFTFNESNLRDQGVSPKTNPLFLALVKSPLLRSHEVSDKGAESPLLADADVFGIGNPKTLTDVAQGVNKNYRFFGSIGFNYLLSPAFSLSTVVGVTNDKVRETFFVPRKGTTPDTLSNDVAFSRSGSVVKTLFALYNDTRLTFNKRFSRVHEITARAGAMYLYNKTERDYGLGYNSAIDELVSVGNGVNSLRRIGGSAGQERWLNGYLSADYTYADKYILSLNMGVSGSSRFGTAVADAFTFNGNKYAVLPSVAAAWLLSSENFLKGSFVDLLKIRGSYGLSGNDDIGNYTARQTYTSQNLLGVEGLVRNGFGNNALQWETVKKANVGLDAALAKERLSFSIDVYRNRTDKMIAYELAPVASGLSFATSNSAGMTTKGVEASLNARVLNTALFKWDLGFNIGRYRTTVDRLPSGRVLNSFAGATYATMVGYAPNVFYGFKTAGVYASDAVAANEGLSVRANDGSLVAFKGGDVRFVDINGDKVIDNNDRQIIGNPNPDYFGAFNTRLQYKGLSLDAVFTFVKGAGVYNYTRAQLEAESNYYNQTAAVVNRWRTNGQITDVPKAVWGDPMGNGRFSDRWIEDGSYLRLRTVSLSYDVPFRPGFLRYATVYVTGNNLLTFTRYKGYDPEFNATESLFGRGVDNTLEPQFRSVLLGLRFGL